MYSRKKSRNSRKKSQKSRKIIKKGNQKKFTRRNKEYYKKLQLEEEVSKSVIKKFSEKKPVVSMSHVVPLLKKSKRNLRKGNIPAATMQLLTVLSIVSTLTDQHPNIKEKRLPRKHVGQWTGDPHQLLKYGAEINLKKASKTRKKERMKHRRTKKNKT
jgi:hypothetical protein